jgi:hypothetical protein
MHFDMEELDNMVETLEILLEAIQDEDSDSSFEAATVLLMQFMEVFGHSNEIMQNFFPVLEKLKDHIQSDSFDEATPIVLALLAKLRQTNEETG